MRFSCSVKSGASSFLPAAFFENALRLPVFFAPVPPPFCGPARAHIPTERVCIYKTILRKSKQFFITFDTKVLFFIHNIFAI